MYSDEQISILSGIQKMAKKYGMKLLADVVSLSPQTLYADLDPNSLERRTNKLGFLDWLKIIEETKNLTPLDDVNRLFGRISLPIPKKTEEMTQASWMKFCATIAKESGEAVAELAEAISDGKITNEELERVEKETWEALQAFASLYLAIKSNQKD